MIVGFLLLLHFVACLHTASSETVTHDELWHLPVGIRNLRDGRFDIDRLNPPLSRMWAAVPLVLAGIEVDQETFGAMTGRQFVEDHPQHFHAYYVWGRAFHIFWTLATAILIYVWSRKVYGKIAALFTLLIYVTCPNITAHASLVTPDSAIMFGFIATLYTLCRWSDRPGWGRAILWGALLGVAQSIKFTGLLLYPLALAIPCIRRWRNPDCLKESWQSLIGQFTVAILISLFVLWSSYGFQQLFEPLNEYNFQSSELAVVQKLFEFIPGLPVPFPADYIRGIDEQRFIMENPHPVFLDGQWSITGFRNYYVMTLLYKIPHISQLLFVLAIIFFALGIGGSRHWRDVLTLLLPVFLLLGVASGEGMQLGVRYVLPVLPLMMIFASSAVCGVANFPLRTWQFLVVVFVLLCGSSLRYQPHHLAYFNEWAGGPIGGREHLLDSNIDWGQDLLNLHRHMQEQGIESIGLAYFGTVPPQVLGIQFELPPSWKPEPGIYAVSVNYVMGRPHVITRGDGTSRSVDFQEFGYFRFFRPEITLGGSIDIYRLDEEDVQAWEQAMQAFENSRTRYQ